jgi:putative intracellular protease/amidase
MDFAGLWEVFTAAVSGMPSDRVITIAERSRPITCEMGMRVIPDLPYGEAPEVDVILVPGGSGARREIANPATTNWLRNAAAKCTWLARVCTGALLLVGAGLARGRSITMHHDSIHAGGGMLGCGGGRALCPRRQSRNRGWRHVGHRDVALAGGTAPWGGSRGEGEVVHYDYPRRGRVEGI